MTSDRGSYPNCPLSVWLPAWLVLAIGFPAIKITGIIFDNPELASIPWLLVLIPYYPIIPIGILYFLARRSSL